MRYVNGTRLDDRIVRTDWDVGFKEGRQYGRGKTGGQVSAMYGSHNSTVNSVLRDHRYEEPPVLRDHTFPWQKELHLIATEPVTKDHLC